jgi:hypothetical protein
METRCPACHGWPSLRGQESSEHEACSCLAPAQQQPHETHSAHRPGVGQRITRHGAQVGIVRKVEGELCFLDDSPATFIWCFHDGLNKLHDWPTTTAPRARADG